MTIEEVIARCEKRLAEIDKNKDDGVYAKRYKEDVPALIKEIHELKETVGNLYFATGSMERTNED